MIRTRLVFLGLGLFLFAQAVQADWTPAKRITWSSGLSFAPTIAVDLTGNIHVVWQDAKPGNFAIYYKKSTDGGAGWTQSKRLSWTSGGAYAPDLAVDSLGYLHLVWYDASPGNYEIYYKKSTDGGATWTASKRLTWTSGDSAEPAIGVDSSGNPQAVWQDKTPGNREIYFARSTDGGAVWKAARRLTWTAEWSEYPAIAVDSSANPHVVWQNMASFSWDVFYRKSTDGGNNWISTKRLTSTSSNSTAPAVALDCFGNLHVVSSDDTSGLYDIYYLQSTDGGMAWTTAQRIAVTSGYSADPAVAVDPSADLHVVWKDDTPGNFELYYTKSANKGVTWATSKRLTWNSGKSENPSIAADSFGNLHLVWDDDTPVNGEIYYKKFIK